MDESNTKRAKKDPSRTFFPFYWVSLGEPDVTPIEHLNTSDILPFRHGYCSTALKESQRGKILAFPSNFPYFESRAFARLFLYATILFLPLSLTSLCVVLGLIPSSNQARATAALPKGKIKYRRFPDGKQSFSKQKVLHERISTL